MSATGDRADAGFTLLEVLTTLAIMVLITGLVFPNVLKPLEHMPLAEARAALAANLRAARADAATSGHSVTLDLAEDGKSYGWARAGVDLPAGVTVETGPRSVTFFADGSSSGGRWRIADRRRALEVVVDPDVGVVKAGGVVTAGAS